LREIRRVLREGPKDVSIGTLDSIGLLDGAFTRESAVGMARVILADFHSRKALAKAEALLVALATVPNATREALRKALRFERRAMRYNARHNGRASERWALGEERKDGRRQARKYNTVGAQRDYTPEERAAYEKLPRYTEEEARVATQHAIDIETERERGLAALDLAGAGWEANFLSMDRLNIVG
jgi:hypothetical protein